ncbi:MAG: hypothetical protein MMC33_010104 [Icmadophila ericetorum]|nr:hypothetical protein [Icmadophila ericetorum]
MDAPAIGTVVKELHGDLVRKYRMHAAAVEDIWRSFDRHQREICLKAGALDGIVLKHSLDTSMGNVYKIIPEWNLRDITERGPEFFLNLLKHRATQSLFEQYCSGVNGEAGDHALILENMRTRNLRHVESFKNCYTFFLDDEKYGQSFEVLSDRARILEGFQPAIRAGLCIPQSTGELILQRQVTLLQSLNIMIEDILDQGSKSRDRKERPKKSNAVALTVLSKPSIHTPSTKLSLPQLVSSALDQRDLLKDYLGLLSTEPVVLSHAVNIWFFSRPELLPDEKGRRMPVHTDRYISGAFFETIHGTVKAAATWDYTSRLLEFLESRASDKVYRAIILQELSNICHLEYSRAQAIFKRYVQSGTGSEWFYRLSNVHDKGGNTRVAMRDNPEKLTRADPQLHYILRLCQSQTNASEAVEWLKKLGGLHESHPMEREKLDEREVDALYDLAVIIEFIKDLSSAISMPSFSRKKGQMFVSRVQDLEAELNQLKPKIDLSDYAVPIDHLLEPGMSQNALEALDRFVVETAGTNMGFIYQDLVEECFADLQNQYQQVTDIVSQKGKIELPPLAIPAPQSLEKQFEERKQKEKTRPPHSAAYEIVPRSETSIQEESLPPSQTFKVRRSTAEVFSNLYEKSQSRGSVSWEAFKAAMAEIGFSTLPKYGSVYTFFPPDNMEVKKPLTLHRPHKSRIEGYKALSFARRLKRLYGWSQQTFQIA